jgi:hypothetical protein
VHECHGVEVQSRLFEFDWRVEMDVREIRMFSGRCISGVSRSSWGWLEHLTSTGW